MHIRLIAVGERQPGWVTEAFDDYVKRLPRQWAFRLDMVAIGARTRDNDAGKAAAVEGDRILRQVKAAEQVVLLDEAGKALSSRELADNLGEWQTNGRDLVLIIGGPDGVSPACAQRADFRWSLSRLTLPHGLARVVVAEQLYRAWSLTQGHPYHRA